MPSNFFWYDLVTTDTEAAAKFYGEVVGWSYQDMSSHENAYGIFKVGEAGVCGLMPFPEGMQGHPGWNGYIAVDDVDAAAEQIKALGGAIHRGPIEVPDVIKFAVATDPQGAVFIVAKGLSTMPVPELPVGTPGTMGWRELFAADWQSDFEFYSKLFGWTKADTHDMGPDVGVYQLFAAGGHPIGGMMNRPAVMTMSWWNYYINVEDIDAAKARVEKAGGSIKMGPMQVPGGQWVLQAQDPQGAFFALVAPGQ